MSETNEVYRKENCPFGKKAVKVLTREGIQFEDHIFSSEGEEKQFKQKHSVKTTPQVFINGDRVGGYSDLAEKYGEVEEESDDQRTYKPVIAVFGTTALLALASSTGIMGFMGFSLAVLALLKLMDIPSFVEGFKKYDLLTKVFPPYGKVYPFLELIAGLGYVSGVLPIATGVVSTFVGIAGGISVFKAVYIDKKDLDCACVGGNQSVPLGIISFTENAMMAVMGLYVLALYTY